MYGANFILDILHSYHGSVECFRTGEYTAQCVGILEGLIFE